MIFKHVAFFVAAAIMTLVVIGCASAPQRPVMSIKGDYQYLQEYLTWSILKEMDKHDVKGLSIAIIDGQKIVWKKGFGMADEEKKLAASSQTVYRIGSISKVITATKIMLMHQSGKIDIDDDVANYIKDFSVKSRFKNTKPITLRSLLSHHSGLPSDILAGMWVHEPMSLSEVVNNIKDESLTSPPQTMHKYSNIAYSVLGRVLEIVDNKPFSQIMDDDFLQPLEMVHSSYNITPEIERYYAKGYRKGKMVARTALRDLPAGSMLSNVDDMGKFIHFIFSEQKFKNKIHIQSDALKSMFAPQYSESVLDFNHAVGFDWVLGGLTSSITDLIVWHNGGAAPHQAHISLLPDKKLGVVIMANTDEASQFITELGIKSLELAVEAKFGRVLPEQEPPNDIVFANVENNILDRYAGNYVVFGSMTPITKNGNHLEIELWGNKLDLIPVSDDTFVPQATALGFISVPLLKYSLQFKTVQGKSLALLHGLPAPLAFQKVTASKISKAWKKRLGFYQANTTDELFEFKKLYLEFSEGVLFFNVTIEDKLTDSETKLKIALSPLSDIEAVVTGLANGEGGTVRVIKTGESENLYYSGFILSPIAKKH